MTRLYFGCFCCALVALPFSAAQQDDPPLQQALALQQLIQKTIEQAEPSIACLVVSRSDFYQKYGYEYSPYEPGKLGGYDPKRIDDYLQKKGLPREKRDEIVKQLDLADADNVPETYGSGVAVDDKGLILTHYHVVQGATKVFVRLPGGKAGYADIHAADPRSDLAVLHLQDATVQLKPLPLGKGENAKRGQFVVLLTNRFAAGMNDGQASASFGIISNIGRATPKNPAVKESQKTIHHYGTLLQTDVQLQNGCSGGALVGLDGKLLGLTTAQAALHGIDVPGGFAMPMNGTMRQIVDILRKGEEVEYGFLGVGFTSMKKPGKGVLLSNVLDGSPADQQGLRPGDAILAVDEQTINGSNDMYLALAGLLAGTKTKLEVRKAGKKFAETVTVSLTKSHVAGKTIAAHTRRPFFRGFRVDHTSLSVQCKFPGFNYESIPRGVLVLDVQPGSPAATALLKSGEVISHVNNVAVETPDQFYQLMSGQKGPVELTLLGQSGQPAPKVTIN